MILFKFHSCKFGILDLCVSDGRKNFMLSNTFKKNVNFMQVSGNILNKFISFLTVQIMLDFEVRSGAEER